MGDKAYQYVLYNNEWIPQTSDTSGGVIVSGITELFQSLNWSIASLDNETADNSDKTFTVPTAKEYQILWIWVEYTSTATAGNRQLCIEIQDAAGDVIAQAARVGTVQTASLTRNYLFAPAAADLLAFRDTDYITTPLPPTLFLSAGQKVRVYDKAAVAAAADDMVVQMQVATRSV